MEIIGEGLEFDEMKGLRVMMKKRVGVGWISG